MSDDILSKLNQAFDHVEAGRLDEAIAILKPVLDATPDNADAWWIYLHAVSDPAEARSALQNVLRIAPDYPGASEMLDILNVQSPPQPRPTIKPLSPPPTSIPEAPPTIPEEPVAASQTRPKYEEVTSPPAPSAPERRRSLLPTLIIAAIVIIALILVAALVLPGMQPQPPATETVVVVADVTETPLPVQVEATATLEEGVADATDEVPDVATATPEPEVEATEAVVEPVEATESAAATAEATDDVSGGEIDSALAAFSLAPEGITDEEIGDAPTVVANVCSAPGREVRTLLPQVMEALASASDSLPEDAGIGTRLVNCADGSTLVTVVASRENVEAFAAGTLSASEFAASWTPVR